MPHLPISPALTSWRMNDSFTVKRRSNPVNARGRNYPTVSATFTDVQGVVSPTSPDQLQRLSDQQNMNKTISIITTFRLRGAADDNIAPDWVIWEEDTYQVLSVDDWSRYVPGYVQVVCGLIENQPTPS